MKTPVFNVQEAYELSIRLPEIRGKAQLMDLKVPYPNMFFLFKSADITYVIHLYQVPDEISPFMPPKMGLAEDGKCRVAAFTTLFFANDKALDLGILWLYSKIEFGNHAKATVLCDAPENLPPDKQAQFKEAFLPYYSSALNTTLFALKLMNCNNIQYLDCNPNKRICNKKKKNKKPYVVYKILQIDPISPNPRTRLTPSDAPPNAQRIHTVRGHFKTYTQERPLFGRLIGTFWWGDCVKGNPAFGLVEKDYEIKIESKILKNLGASSHAPT